MIWRALVLCGLLLALQGCQERSNRPEARASRVEVERRGADQWLGEVRAMGTSFAVKLDFRTRWEALGDLATAFLVLERFEAKISEWREGSEIDRLNRATPGLWVRLSPEVYAPLQRALEASKWSEGAFDPTCGRCVDHWKRGARCVLPMGGLELGEGRARWAQEGGQITTGGFAKGAGIDRVFEVLQARGLTRMIIDGGGELRALSDTSEPWRIAVAGVEGVLELSTGAVATSGRAYQSVEVDGRIHHHLFDPRLGELAPGPWQLSARAGTALEADILSTASFLLFHETRPLRVQGASGEVLVVTEEGEVRWTAGFWE